MFGQIATYTGSGGISTTVTGYPNETVTSLMDIGFGSNTACGSGGLSGKTVATTWSTYNTSGPHYYIKITPNPGYQLDVTGFNAGMRVSNTGPTKVRYAYSLDNGVTWTDDGVDHPLSNPGCGSSIASSWGGGPLPTGITSTTNGIIVALFPFAPGGATGTFQANYINILGSVNPSCTPPVITVSPSVASVCAGSNVALTTTGAGAAGTYTWLPAATLSASTGTTVTATPASTTTYTVTGYSSTTCSASTTVTVTVNNPPAVAAITGSNSVCAGGATISLFNAVTGGSWSVTNTALATITSSGVVTGIAPGTDTARYAVTNTCGTTTVIYPFTIDPLPVAGTITGPSAVCVGAIVTMSNSTAAPTGSWSVSNPTLATITSSGIVTGISAGSDTAVYTVTSVCGTASAIRPFTVNPLPLPGSIIGPGSVCAGSSISLANITAIPAGSWSITNPLLATITSAGVVTGISAGTDTARYTVANTCGTAFVDYPFTINPLPTGGAITGPDSVCVGASVSLSNTTATPGGTWSSANTAVATVSGSAAWGVSAASTIISYSVTTGCGTTGAAHTLIVKALPNAGTISGPDSVCSGTFISLTPSVSGGLWSTASASIASASSAGIVTGISASLATTTISYTVSTFSCGSATATHPVTVKPQPFAGVASGVRICQLNSAALGTTVSGGSWTTSAPGIATITTGNTVYGISAGTAIFTYSVTNSCGTATDTATVTVSPLPALITGAAILCVGLSASLADATPGGFWTSSAPAIATVSGSGVTTGLTPGSATISYTLPATGCYTTVSMVVQLSVPASVTVTAGANNVCAGTTVDYLAIPVNGGPSPILVWSVNNVIIAGGATYSYIPEDGDLVRCWMLSSLGCAVPDTASASLTMTVNHIAMPAVSLSLPGGDTTCLGILTSLMPAATDGGLSPFYRWFVNGSFIATGPVFNYVPDNGDVVTVRMTSNAPCRSYDTASATLILTVSPYLTPAVSITTDPGVISCESYPVIFAATPTNGGTMPTYSWTVNGLAAGTGAYLTYPPANGDVVQVILNSNFPCVTTPAATAATAMTVLPVVQPVGTITAVPGYIIAPGTYDTFTVTIVSGGGSAPLYQWFRNAVPVPGATNTVYITNDLHNGDSVSCQVTNTDQCSGISVFDNIHIIVSNNVSVGHINTTIDGVAIMPNPAKEQFCISGLMNTNTATITIADMTGRAVFSDILQVTNATSAPVKISDLPAGIYLVTVASGQQHTTLRLEITGSGRL